MYRDLDMIKKFKNENAVLLLDERSFPLREREREREKGSNPVINMSWVDLIAAT